MMSAADVLAVLALARAAGAGVWLAGGWGVDALAGEQTRPHRDVDLCHRSQGEPRLPAALAGAGYVQTLDARPVRFVLSGPGGREIDLHPLEFAADGSALQSSFDPDSPFRYPADCFTSGTVAGTQCRASPPRSRCTSTRGTSPPSATGTTCACSGSASVSRHRTDHGVARGPGVTRIGWRCPIRCPGAQRMGQEWGP